MGEFSNLLKLFFLSSSFCHLPSCWSRNYNMNYWLIIRLPILIAIGVSMEYMQYCMM